MKRLVLVIAVVVLMGTLPSFADSFSTVALQNNGFVSVTLGPGLDPLLNPTTSPSQLSFITSFGPIGAVTFSSTLDIAGQQFTFGPISLTCTNPSGCGELFGWTLPLSSRPINGILTVNLNGVTQTYDFRYQTPVPEPSTMLLTGSGLMTVSWLKSFLRRKRSS